VKVKSDIYGIIDKMSKIDFDEFINNQIETKSDENPIDWDMKRDEWLESLSKFYNKVETFLEEYVKDEKVKLLDEDKKIFAEYIGEYSVRILNIELGSHKLKLEPIGTNLIGAKGRVDLIGANGTVKFVLVNKNSASPETKINIWIKGEEPPGKDDEPEVIEWDWKISTPPPRIRYINLEQETFLDALMEVMGG
jgi:hypothetical protein